MLFFALFLGAISFGHGQEKSDPLPPVYILNYDHLGVILWGEESIHWALDIEYERLGKYNDYTIGWDHEAYTYDYLAANSPGVLRRMQQGIKSYPGRLAIGTSTYGQPLSRFINEESNIRQLTLGRSTVEKYFNVSPQVYLMGEHAFHSQMPQLLKGAGYTGAIMRTHFMMFGYNPTIKAAVVRWEGVDGSTITTLPTYPGQEHFAVPASPFPYGAVTLDGVIMTDFVRRKRATLQDFRAQFGKDIRPLVASRADDPRQPDEILEIHQGDPNFIWTVADSIFNYLPTPRKTFFTAPTDFAERMPWGYCGNWIWNKSRAAEVNVLTAERLAAMHSALGGNTREDELLKSWKNLLVAQHHDIQIVGIEKAGKVFLEASLAQSQAVIDEAMEGIALQMAGAKDEWVVFNPLNWPRKDVVSFGEGAKGVVEAGGLSFYRVKPTATGVGDDFQWNAAERQLITPYYDVTLSEDGGFTRMIDRASGRKVITEGRRSGMLQAHVNGKPAGSKGSVELQKKDHGWVVAEQGKIGSIPYELSWTFYSFTPRIDYALKITVQDEKIGEFTDDPADPYASFEHGQKLRLKFFPELYDRVVGIEDHPFMITETNREVLQGNYWNAISDGNLGLAYFNKGTMCSFREPGGSFSVPLAFSTAFIWNTVPMKGDYTYEMALYPFTGHWREAGLHKRALEFNYPLIATHAKGGKKGKLGNQWTPLEISSDGAILSALYTHQGETYARFYEYRGKNPSLTGSWLERPIEFTEVDFNHHFEARQGGSFVMTPWQVSTFRIGERVEGKDYSEVDIPLTIDFKYEHDWTESKWLKPNGITEDELNRSVIK